MGMAMKMRRTLFATVAALALAAAAGGAEAAAYSFATAPVSFDTQLSLGFTFTPNVNVSVTGLGYYDLGGDGFLTDHQVGIYLGDGGFGAGPLLTSTTLGAGTSGTLGANDFRYQSITPLTLLAGQSYTIAGLSPLFGGNDAWVYGGPNEFTGFSVDPRITIGPNAARYTYFPGGLVDPSSHYADYQFYAVNFEMSSGQGVPEPASWALMISGFGLAGVALRRRRQALA
jgi:hypothetical protein